jgi:hypothetical protein
MSGGGGEGSVGGEGERWDDASIVAGVDKVLKRLVDDLVLSELPLPPPQQQKQ